MVSASFFDLDGTLNKGWLMYEFSKHLVSANLISRENFHKIEKWKNLFFEHKVSYRKIAIKIPRIYAISFKDRREAIVRKEAKHFVKEVIDRHLYPYAKTLTTIMKKHGMTIGISGAPAEIVLLLGEYFDFDLTYGTKLEVDKGIYTGKLKQNLVLRETKEAIIEKIVDEHTIDLHKSFGFGDTEQDLAFLSRVGYPVALNPNQKLLFIAKKKGWTIIYSGDNIIDKISIVLQGQKS